MDFDSDTDSYSAIDSSMNTEFSSTLGARQGLNDPGGYGNFGVPSGSFGGTFGNSPSSLGGTFGSNTPPDDEGSPF